MIPSEWYRSGNGDCISGIGENRTENSLAVFVCKEAIQCHPHHHSHFVGGGGCGDCSYGVRAECDEWVWRDGGAAVFAI